MVSSVTRQASAPESQTSLLGLPWSEVLLIAALVAAALTLFRVYADDTAGGADSYGYVSEALRISRGHFYETEHVFTPFGLPEISPMTAPLGYWPKDPLGTAPTYPFGYPLLMAAPIRLFGLAAAFWVTPVLATAALVLTYVAARPRLGWAGGLLASVLVLLLPNFIWGAVQPLSDVPATFTGALAICILMQPRPRAWADVVLGAAVGLGVWIRPNMALLIIPVAAWLLWHRDADRLRRFALGILPFALIEAAVNWSQYDVPWNTGYGQPALSHSLQDIVERGLRYLGRLNEQQAGVGLLLVTAGLVFGRLPFAYRLLLIGSSGLLLAFFSTYPFDDAWWYGRYLLPGLPAVAILEASAVCRLMDPDKLRSPLIAVLILGVGVLAYALLAWDALLSLATWYPRLVLLAVLAVAVIEACAALHLANAYILRLTRAAALSVGCISLASASLVWAEQHRVYQVGLDELRYKTAAEFAREHIQQPAVVLAVQHSGSLRLYGNLATARYDYPDLAALLSEMDEVRSAGGTMYLVAEEWEIADIQSQRPALLQGATELGYVEPGRVTLFRLDSGLSRSPAEAEFAGKPDEH